MYCKNCGVELDNDSKYCKVCGTEKDVETIVKINARESNNSAFTKALVSIIVSIIGFSLSFLPIINIFAFVLGVIGLVFGIISLVSGIKLPSYCNNKYTTIIISSVGILISTSCLVTSGFLVILL